MGGEKRVFEVLREASGVEEARTRHNMFALFDAMEALGLDPMGGVELVLNFLIRVHGRVDEEGELLLEEALEQVLRIMRSRRQGDA